MSPLPVVSVVMPMYNAQDSLFEAVLTVKAQTFRGWELILVDDGSTDQTLDMALDLAEGDPRIRVTTQENAGPADARNTGIRLARGRLIAFLDADDRWHTTRLAVCLDHFARNPQAGIVFTRLAFTGPEGKPVSEPTRHVEQLGPEDLLSENPVCTTSNIVARAVLLEKLNGFNKRMAYLEDQDLLFRTAAASSWTVEGIDRVLLDYRISTTSRASDLRNTARSWRIFMSAAHAIAPELLRPRHRAVKADFHRNQARRAVRDGLPLTALSCLFTALLKDPLIAARQPRRVGLTLAAALALFIPLPQLKEYVR